MAHGLDLLVFVPARIAVVPVMTSGVEDPNNKEAAEPQKEKSSVSVSVQQNYP